MDKPHQLLGMGKYPSALLSKPLLLRVGSLDASISLD